MDINTLVQGFARHIRQLKAPEYKESRLRQDYLDPFWELLGWDVGNEQQVAPQDVEVLIEPSMDTVEEEGLSVRSPDYIFRPNAFPRFVVEAKANLQKGSLADRDRRSLEREVESQERRINEAVFRLYGVNESPAD